MAQTYVYEGTQVPGTFLASAAIAQGDLVYVNGTSGLALHDAGTDKFPQAVAPFKITSGDYGEIITGVVVLEDADWAWTPGAVVYAGAVDGRLAASGEAGHEMAVGYAVTATKVVLYLGLLNNLLSVQAGSYVAGSIDNADVAAAAVIAVTKLAALSAGKILLGNASNVNTAVTPSGDVTITNAGVTAIGAAKVLLSMIALASLDGTIAKEVANANVIGGVPVLHRIDIAAGANADTDVTLTHKTRVVDAWLVLTGTGVASAVFTVKSTANAITDGMAASGADKAVVRAATIDDANHEIAAAGILRVTGSAGATQPAATVYVLGIRVA